MVPTVESALANATEEMQQQQTPIANVTEEMQQTPPIKRKKPNAVVSLTN
jgi:hypothetical protein